MIALSVALVVCVVAVGVLARDVAVRALDAQIAEARRREQSDIARRLDELEARVSHCEGGVRDLSSMAALGGQRRR